MQTQRGDVTAQAPAMPTQTAAQPADLPPIPDAPARQREELNILYLGFACGLSIGGVFLIYIIMEFAKYLP